MIRNKKINIRQRRRLTRLINRDNKLVDVKVTLLPTATDPNKVVDEIANILSMYERGETTPFEDY